MESERDGNTRNLDTLNAIESVRQAGRHQAYFVHSPLSIIVTDVTGRYVEVNPAACRTTGYDEAELLDMSLTDLLAEESREAGELYFARVKEIGRATGEFCWVRKDGTKRWSNCNAVKLSADRFAGFFLDVTERRESAESLASAHRLLAALLDAVPDLLLVVDRDYGIRYTNAKGHDLIQQADPQKRATCYGRFKLLDAPCDDCSARPVFETACTIEREMVNPADGRTREIRAFPIIDSVGRVAAVVEHVRDVTERKTAEVVLAAERDLALRLLSLHRLDEVVRACLDAALTISGFDGGGVYLTDSSGGKLQLACHTGLSPAFVTAEASYTLGSVQAEVLAKGATAFVTRAEMERHGLRALLREGLASVMAVPVFSRGIPVACLNLASRTKDVLSAHTHVGVEAVAAQLGTAIARAQAEELRRQSEERYRLLVEASPCSILVAQEGRYVYGNPYALSTLGYSHEELIQVPVFDTIHPDSREVLLRRMQSVERGVSNPPVEIRVLRHDGIVVDAETVSVPIMFGGKPAALVIGQDITLRKQAENQLRLQALVLNQIQDRVTVTDLDGVVTYVNDAECSLLKSPRESLVGRSVTSYGEDPSRGATQAEIINTTLADGGWRGEVVNYAADGSEITIDCRTSLVKDENGRPVAMCGIGTDVTERRRTEESLRRSEARYRTLFESMSQGAFCQQADGRLVDVNPGLLRLVGLTRDEFLSRTSRSAAWDVIREDGSPLPGPQRPSMVALQSGQPVHNVVVGILNQQTKHRVWVEIDAIPEFRPGEEKPYQVLATVHDITDRRRAEQEKLAMERRLLHAQKLESLGVLAGGVAHDFNNILSIIMGYADLLDSHLPGSDPAHHDVNVIMRAVQRAAGLTQQMLAYAGKGKFLVEPLDLSRLIDDARSMLEASVSKKVTVSYKFAPNLAPIVADASQINQVVLNLIVNASEAIGDSVGSIQVGTDTVDCGEADLGPQGKECDLKAGRYVRLKVVDTGCGMDRETLGKIFDPFFTTKFTGRGLGLAAVQGIVRSHGGAIRVTSAPGCGTTFVVFFPVGDTPAPAPANETVAANSWQGSGVILVVDDEESMRMWAQSALEGVGFAVVTAGDGEEAVRLYEQRYAEIACVLLDLTMPKLNGEETFRELCRIRPDVRVILSSGNSEEESVERFSGMGLAAFLHKPYRGDALIAAVRKAVERDEDGCVADDRTIV